MRYARAVLRWRSGRFFECGSLSVGQVDRIAEPEIASARQDVVDFAFGPAHLVDQRGQPHLRVHGLVGRLAAAGNVPSVSSAAQASELIPLPTTTASRSAIDQLGLGSAAEGAPLGDHELEAVRALGLDHLRVDVHPAGPGWEERLQQGRAEAQDRQDAVERVEARQVDGEHLVPEELLDRLLRRRVRQSCQLRHHS